jgi:hypothetical protein
MIAAHNQAKEFATLRAQYALRGHVVHQLIGGGYLVCRHGHAFHAPDLSALRAFAVRVGVIQDRGGDHG